MLGCPFSSKNEINASPIPSLVIVCSALKLGFARMVSAEALTAF